MSEKAREEHIKQDKCSHQTGVAEYMRERADDFGVDGNIAYIIGHNHDIGYLEGRWFHEQTGADMLRKAGFGEDICYAIEHHGDDLAKLNQEKPVSPYLVLLVEADLSVEMHGYRVGFDKRLEDIAKRNGTENNPQYDMVKNNIGFIKEYWAEHNIPSQDKVVKAKPTGKTNHGSGKWAGSELKARLAQEHQNRIEHAAFDMMQSFVFNRGTGAVFEDGGNDVTDEVKNPEHDSRYFFDDTYYDYDLEQNGIHGAGEIKEVGEFVKKTFQEVGAVGSVDIGQYEIYLSMGFEMTDKAEQILKDNGYDWGLVGELEQDNSMVITDNKEQAQALVDNEFGGIDDGSSAVQEESSFAFLNFGGTDNWLMQDVDNEKLTGFAVRVTDFSADICEQLIKTVNEDKLEVLRTHKDHNQVWHCLSDEAQAALRHENSDFCDACIQFFADGTIDEMTLTVDRGVYEKEYATIPACMLPDNLVNLITEKFQEAMGVTPAEYAEQEQENFKKHNIDYDD